MTSWLSYPMTCVASQTSTGVLHSAIDSPTRDRESIWELTNEALLVHVGSPLPFDGLISCAEQRLDATLRPIPASPILLRELDSSARKGVPATSWASWLAPSWCVSIPSGLVGVFRPRPMWKGVQVVVSLHRHIVDKNCGRAKYCPDDFRSCRCIWTCWEVLVQPSNSLLVCECHQVIFRFSVLIKHLISSVQISLFERASWKVIMVCQSRYYDKGWVDHWLLVN